MYSKYLANTNDSESLSDNFYVGKTLYLVYISSTAQAFSGLKSQGQGVRMITQQHIVYNVNVLLRRSDCDAILQRHLTSKYELLADDTEHCARPFTFIFSEHASTESWS